MANAHLRLIASTNIKQTVVSRRRPNSIYRTREYLTETEIEKLLEATKGNRYGHRDATMILVAFRHGLRVAELVGLHWDQVDFEGGVLHVARNKRLRRAPTRSPAASFVHCAASNAKPRPRAHSCS